MRADWPGLMKERLPSGGFRYRVRAEGNPALKITLPCGPDDKRFREQYHAARQGQRPEPASSAISGSVGWLVDLYIKAMPSLQLDPGTIKQRAVFLNWLRSQRGEYRADMPKPELMRLRDMKAHTPGAADNFIKAVRAMYAWGISRGHLAANPAEGIEKINRGMGARPWSLNDLAAFREYHPASTMPHRALTLFMFTACRIGDAFRLGPGNEVERDGITWLDWQPAKKGSTRVTIPMLPPLYEATRGLTGPAYLTSEWGQPYASATAFGNAFRDWVVDAGLVDAEGKAARSAHGIRKSVGELLAMKGATQYEITAVHGHLSARTSEVYTRGYNRTILGEMAMNRMKDFEW